MYDRVLDDPRLSHWYTRDAPLPHPALDAIGRDLDALLGVRVFGPACNYYRDGNDSVAWHADRELRELSDTRIAIVTLGRAPAVPAPPEGRRQVTRPRARVGRPARDGRRVPDALGARGAEVEGRRPARLLFVALEREGQSPGVFIVMTLNIAPAGSAHTANRPGSMSIGPWKTAPPLALIELDRLVGVVDREVDAPHRRDARHRRLHRAADAAVAELELGVRPVGRAARPSQPKIFL